MFELKNGDTSPAIVADVFMVPGHPLNMRFGYWLVGQCGRLDLAG